ncbi:hypothetical protein [Tenacibaculum xiamenense]|uniref:hypothetical protein n=1 Tax=Tenacibaculum xiamenense TaxID=1261553 RepID=UPI0038954F52
MKNLLKLGTALNKTRQKEIHGGVHLIHVGDDGAGCYMEHMDRCPDGSTCDPFSSDWTTCNGSGCGHWFKVC